MNSLTCISGHGFRGLKSVVAPSNISNIAATYTATSATITWTGGTSISAVTHTWTVLDWKGTTITGYTVSGVGSGTVISGLPSTTFWVIQLLISNAGGSVNNTKITGRFKAAWTFENGTTSGLINDINSVYTLTPYGTAALNGFSRYGSNSLYCDGTSYCQLLHSGNNMNNLMVVAISVSFWVYPTVISNNGYFFHGACQISSEGGYIAYNSGGARQAISDAPLPLNTWTHICFTFVNDYQQALYVNNTLVNVGVFGWAYVISNTIRFGGYGCSAYFDNIYIYNRLLTAGEVTTLYNGGDVAW